MTTINVVGGTNVYLQQNGVNIEYSVDLTNWTVVAAFPITVSNTTSGSGVVTVILTTSITLTASNQYFICGSPDIQFGKTTLNNDGSRAVITVNGVSNYPGLIQNGTFSTNGYNNVAIYNIIVNSTSSTLSNNGGWIGQENYSRGCTNNTIINCSSNGPIPDFGGGIAGGRACRSTGSSLLIRCCTSSGDLGNSAGGIVGGGSCNTGILTVDRCSSSGLISSSAGGIIGYASCTNNGTCNVSNCYSTGTITGGGGIFGYLAGLGGPANAINCYSTGTMNGNSGGIYGVSAGTALATATNCYSIGDIKNNSGGIYASFYGNAAANNCYTSGMSDIINTSGIWSGSTSDGVSNYSEANNGSSGWNTARANTVLTGVPTTSNYGSAWSSLVLGQPYVLSLSGYTPYSLSLVETFSSTVQAGNSTPIPIVPGYGSFTLLGINSGLPSAVPEITINSSTGIISTTSSLKPGSYTLYIYSSINPYNVTIYTLTVSEAAVTGVTSCCALSTDFPNFDYTYRYGIVTGNAVLADNYRRGPYPDYSFYYAKKMAAASKR